MNLKKLLTEHGVTQTELAGILGRDKSVITNLFQGKRQLKAGEAALIAAHLGVPITSVMGLEEHSGFSEGPLLIPFQHAPTNSRGMPNIIEKDGTFYIEESSNFSSKAFALEVRDDSMNLAGLLTGDIVISELDRPCSAGQLVIAQHYQGHGATTIIRRFAPPMLTPHSSNAAFRPINADNSDVRLVAPVLKLIRQYVSAS